MEDVKNETIDTENKRLDELEKAKERERKILENSASDIEDYFLNNFKNGFNPNINSSNRSIGQIVVNAVTNGVNASEVADEVATVIYDKIDLKLGGLI